ncbi:MAG: hypothetical protein ACE14P_13120 [Methanotrichaceae archaeon]
MKQSVKLIAILSIVTLALIPLGACANQDIIGTWSVVSQIVTQCSNDPYAPQPGSIMPAVTWAITNSANGPILTSDKGSTPGQYTGNGVVFEFTTPILSLESSYTYCLTHIECYVDSPTSMYGTLENHYRTYNYITGATIETCLETFKFRGMK